MSLNLDKNPAAELNYKKLQAAIAFGEGRYQDVIEINKDVPEMNGLRRQAMAYEKLGNKEKAKEFWSKVLNWNSRGFGGIMWHHNAKKILAEL